MYLFSKVSSLVFLARIKPEIHDALIPHIPLVSEKARNIMASAVIKSITEKITDPEVAKELHSVGKRIFDTASESMSYADDLWPIPHPKPNWLDEIINFGGQFALPFLSFDREEVMLNPQPLPPREQTYYAALITLLADAVSLGNAAESLRSIGTSLMKQATPVYEKYAS